MNKSIWHLGLGSNTLIIKYWL